MNLSEDLKFWRAERPDEWTMDRFIKEAERLESIEKAYNNPDEFRLAIEEEIK